MPPPGLHISLGVYERLWDLLESACTELDLLLAEHLSGGRTGDSFESYVDALRKRDRLKSSMATEEQKANNTLEQLLTFLSLTLPATTPSLLIISEEAKKTRINMTALVNQKNPYTETVVMSLVCHLEGGA